MKILTLISLCAALVLAGCGGGDSSPGEHSKPTRPTVSVPKGPPPRKLIVKDIKEGTGRPVKTGDEVTVQWSGFLYKSGDEFYSTWDVGQRPFTFQTGAGRVIPGWDRGMVGMKVGGRRELTIPPRLAYESRGSTTVPPNETLIYVIDLRAIR